MKYKITILVTVYNAKKYLKICADSLVNQTCDKKLFEVIFVDDGSTDGSGELCDFYSDKYENFRTIHQKNSGGPSLGRNKGIDNANSDFIYFCDVDDYFNEESVERLIKYIDKWDSDIILTKLNTDTNRDIPRNIFDENYEFDFCRAQLIEDGTDVTVITNGETLAEVIEASEILKSQGYSIQIVHVPVVKPLDGATIIDLVKKTKFVMTVENHFITGGLGSAICELLAEYYPVPVHRIGVNDTFGQSGKWDFLLDYYGLTSQKLVVSIKRYIDKYRLVK